MPQAAERLPLFLVRQAAEQSIRVDLDTRGPVNGLLLCFFGVFPVGLGSGNGLDQADQLGGTRGTTGCRLASRGNVGTGTLAGFGNRDPADRAVSGHIVTTLRLGGGD